MGLVAAVAVAGACSGHGDATFEADGASAATTAASSSSTPTLATGAPPPTAAPATTLPLDVAGLDLAAVWPTSQLGPIGRDNAPVTLPARPQPDDGPPDPGERTERTVSSRDGLATVTVRTMALTSPSLGQAWLSAWDRWATTTGDAASVPGAVDGWQVFTMTTVPIYAYLTHVVLLSRASGASAEVLIVSWLGPAVDAPPDLVAAAAAIAGHL